MPTFVYILTLLISVLLMSCQNRPVLQINQLGHYPDAEKYAVISGIEPDTFILTAITTGKTVSTIPPGDARAWSASGESSRSIDFSTVVTPGTYHLKSKTSRATAEVTIGTSVHIKALKAAVKSFFYNRCSYPLDQKYAGKFARNAGHPDTAVFIHPSAASKLRRAGSTIASPGGWYDAGDYGKYSVNSGIATYTLLAAYEAFPDLFETLTCDIPESGNTIPDIIDEALYNLRWMMTMQDPEDGGVYHKLTSADFCGMIMPEDDNFDRFVVSKSTTATLDVAAVCAHASRLTRQFSTELPGFADSCLAVALKAWGWARANPAVYYYNRDMQNPQVSTGEYRDSVSSDEFRWAATELFLATKADSFFTVAFPDSSLADVTNIPTWQDVEMLSLFSIAVCDTARTAFTQDKIASHFTKIADSLLLLQKQNSYHVAMQNSDFFWGSNSQVANIGIVFTLAHRFTGNDAYKQAALNHLDYLFGKNPVGMSFVTGFGKRSPKFIHHRVSTADGIPEPIPGFLAGGPNYGKQDKKHCDCYTSTFPALSYVDSTCSYASNEVAINWNAPLVFLLGAMEAIYGR